MCTVLMLFRPGGPWPLRVGANRDEQLGRAFLPPARHWAASPGVVAPRDLAGGGTWLGVNDDGVFATIVNGMDRLGPLPGKATRGELVLRALAERDADHAARAIAGQDAARYRGFTMVIADRVSAHAIASDERTLRARRLEPGHHLVTPDGCDVASSPRFATHFPAFAAATPPDPARGEWSSWTELLRHADEHDPHRAMTVMTGTGFGTVCSTLLALPAAVDEAPVLLFANGPPTHTPYEPVPIARVSTVGIER